MKICEQPDYEAMSRAAAGMFREVVARKPDALVCFATGGSPARMYRILSEDPLIRQSSIRALALDEWHGIGARHPATCRYYLEKHVFGPWGLPENRQYCFQADANNPEAECRRMAAVLEREGPIDLCILGLGRNGHLGLNEPADGLLAHAHVASLDEKSQAHPMLVKEGVTLKQGLTFGMADLLQSREILLLICGSGKREPARAFLQGGISTQLPASFLQLHAKTRVVIDASIQ